MSTDSGPGSRHSALLGGSFEPDHFAPPHISDRLEVSSILRQQAALLVTAPVAVAAADICSEHMGWKMAMP
jgi:hypothetical protein